MKLELKHIAPYFPYGVKVHIEDDLTDIVKIKTLSTDMIEDEHGCEMGFYDYRLVLKPMHLLNISYVSELAKFVCSLDEQYTFDFAKKMIESRKNTPLSMPYVVVQKLLEWHFDVFGLIEKGLAININDL